MNDKRRTQRNRQIAKAKIIDQLPLFYREDLEELQQAIADAVQCAALAPGEDQLTAPGEWLEERTVKGRHYVYLRYIDAGGKERGNLIYKGTIAQYKASRNV